MSVHHSHPQSSVLNPSLLDSGLGSLHKQWDISHPLSSKIYTYIPNLWHLDRKSHYGLPEQRSMQGGGE